MLVTDGKLKESYSSKCVEESVPFDKGGPFYIYLWLVCVFSLTLYDDTYILKCPIDNPLAA